MSKRYVFTFRVLNNPLNSIPALQVHTETQREEFRGHSGKKRQAAGRRLVTLVDCLPRPESSEENEQSQSSSDMRVCVLTPPSFLLPSWHWLTSSWPSSPPGSCSSSRPWLWWWPPGWGWCWGGARGDYWQQQHSAPTNVHFKIDSKIWHTTSSGHKQSGC